MTCGLVESETVTAESRVEGGKWQGLGVVWGRAFWNRMAEGAPAVVDEVEMHWRGMCRSSEPRLAIS